MPRIVIEVSPRVSWRAALQEGITRVGGGVSQELRIADSAVADAHCEIVNSAGRIFIRDLGSGKETLLDGVRVVGTLQVANGQVLQLGKIAARFESLRGSQEPLTAVIPMTKPKPRPKPQSDSVTSSPLPQQAAGDPPPPNAPSPRRATGTRAAKPIQERTAYETVTSMMLLTLSLITLIAYRLLEPR